MRRSFSRFYVLLCVFLFFAVIPPMMETASAASASTMISFIVSASAAVPTSAAPVSVVCFCIFNPRSASKENSYNHFDLSSSKLFPKDEKTLGVLHECYEKAKADVKSVVLVKKKKSKKESEKEKGSINKRNGRLGDVVRFFSV